MLIVAGLSPELHAELARCHRPLTPLGDGYHRAQAEGLPFVLMVELNAVSEAEKDDHLRAFSHHTVETPEVVQWLRAYTRSPEDTVLDPKQLVGWEDAIRKIAESLPVKHRLYGLSPEQREELLREIKPEERLANLSESEQVLALPDRLLRLLPGRLRHDAPGRRTDEGARTPRTRWRASRMT